VSATLLGFAGAGIIAAAGVRWLQLMQQVRIPRDKTAFLVANGLGAALGIVAFTLGTGLAGGIAAGIAVAGGMAFLYNLRNPRSFALKSGVIVPLPIPTTILVDADGTVRWIDQSDDYQRRSDPERVLGAIRAVGLAPDQERVTTQSEPRMATRSSSTAIAKSVAPSDLTSPLRTR
jgi:hypothetical protein